MLAHFPLDDAMARAVGGQYECFGAVEGTLLCIGGLRDGMSLIDFGCGSGRLAWAPGQLSMHLDYCGIDVDERLLAYAKSKSPPQFQFAANHVLSLPAPNASADMACAFSVFTHLRHTETYLYLRDIRRVLRPGGRLVFSFLEFAQPKHWKTFEDTAAAELHGGPPHLNEFIERNAIDVWCEKLGYRHETFIDGDAAPWGEPGPLGQSVAILFRP